MSKGEEALALLLCMFQGYPFLFFKIRMIEKNLKDFKSLWPEVDEGTSHLIKDMLKIEASITTVHFSEVFASNLLAFKKGIKRFHKTLLSYSVGDVDEFYEKIGKRRISYIANLLGYPSLHQIEDEELKENLKKSCITVRNKMNEIGEYYLHFKDLYNSYKHGFRIGVAESGYDELYPVIIYLDDRKKLDTGKIMRFGELISKEIEYCNFMTHILGAVTETFIDRVLYKKESWTVTSWG